MINDMSHMPASITAVIIVVLIRWLVSMASDSHQCT